MPLRQDGYRQLKNYNRPLWRKEEFYMNELQDTLEEIMQIFSSQEEMLDIMEEQQKELDFLRNTIQTQDELLKKLNEENAKLSAENQKLAGQNQRLQTQNQQLQELCKE